MGRQGEGGGLKILKIEETSFMDDPLLNSLFFKLKGLTNLTFLLWPISSELLEKKVIYLFLKC